MENFRLWLQVNKYMIPDGYNYSAILSDEEFLKVHPHLMVEYMEEYLCTICGVTPGNPSDIYIRMHEGKKYVEIRYEQLKSIIESGLYELKEFNHE